MKIYRFSAYGAKPVIFFIPCFIYKKTVDYDHVKANVYFDIKSHGLDVT